MVMLKTKRSRNILVYFVESKLWKNYLCKVSDNRNYWVEHDPMRATRMYNAWVDYTAYPKSKGYTVSELIYDMLDCIHSSTLKAPTKVELYKMLDELEQFHEKLETLEEEVYEDIS